MHAVMQGLERRRPAGFFGVAWRRQTYLNLFYLLAAFPLGLTYFVFLVTMIALSFGLAFVLVGIPLAVVTALCWWWLGAFERQLTMWWLDVEIPPMAAPLPLGLTLTQRLGAYARNSVTWKSLLYLFAKFFFGTFAWALFVVLIAGTTALVSAPLAAILRVTGDGGLTPGNIPLLLASPLLTLAGLVVGLFTLHAGNWLAYGWSLFAQWSLGMSETAQRLAEARAAAAQAQAQAVRADQSRRELIVNVSHELRTPIANIRGHVESLLMANEPAAAGTTGDGAPPGAAPPEGEAPPEGQTPPAGETREYLGIVERETERLSALVDDLLALARADAGELRLELGPVDGAAVLEEVYAALGPMARRERQVTLVREVHAGLPPVWADRQRLVQVLLNLARNAIVYTPTGGIVSLSLEPSGQAHLAFVVADTGIGIPPEDLPHVFERFYRTDASRTRATGGFGLGLAIVRDLVQAMGGSVSVESTVGQGSRFRVYLRLVPPEGQPM
jgi:two-component system, OmpR family, phosphate regulon sensor histidine kinase PhoR